MTGSSVLLTSPFDSAFMARLGMKPCSTVDAFEPFVLPLKCRLNDPLSHMSHKCPIPSTVEKALPGMSGKTICPISGSSFSRQDVVTPPLLPYARKDAFTLTLH
jgi:hypothetical protein